MVGTRRSSSLARFTSSVPLHGCEWMPAARSINRIAVRHERHRSTPLRRFGGEAAEFCDGFIVGLHRGSAFGFADGIAALFAEPFDGLDAPKGTAPRSANGRIADLHVHRVRVQLRE